MIASNAPVLSAPRRTARRPGLATARLLRLELRHSAMLWILPVAIALFWVTTYRKTMAMPLLWNLRAASVQTGILVDFVMPVVAAAAWTASREPRRRTADLVAVTARPRWAGLLTTWAATTAWALAGYLVCLASVYGPTARHAPWGGPLWWPAAVAAVGLPAFAALGLAAGVLLPSRFTAPAAAIVAFFVLALSTELIVGSQSYWQVSPIVTGPWDFGFDAGAATFYPFQPDLPIAQVMFLAGLTIAVLAGLILLRGVSGRGPRAAAAAITAAGVLAAGTAVVLAGTARLDDHGMMAIPALHDAASDRPIRYTPVCRRAAIPVCLNPAYAVYLPSVATALQPALRQIAGLPWAPVRVSQSATSYQQGAGNSVTVSRVGQVISGRPPVFHLLLPDQLPSPALTPGELAAQVRASAGPAIVADVIGDGPGASPAQHAVTAALLMAAGLPSQSRPVSARSRAVRPEVAPGSPAYAAARRFATLPASARHAWLAVHLTALRAGRITLEQVP
jgi:hypothetical protein